jgi:hypothetical protein
MRNKANAWREAAMAVEERGRLLAAHADSSEVTRDIANHMVAVVALSLRRRAEIIGRRRTRKS